MRIIDMHCDTLWKLTDTGKNGDLMENDCNAINLSLPRARVSYIVQ